jgi:uncharacterized cupredoxin-like copper-binding protein
VRAIGVLGVCAFLALGVLDLTDSAGAHPRANVASRSHLQVTEIEYHLILSRGVVKAGPVDLEAIDGGMDPHDLRLRHVDATQTIAAPELTPGRRWDGVVKLKPGVYNLWCSLPEHAKLGMHATLRVVR